MDTISKLMILINNMDTSNLYYPILKTILKRPRDIPGLTITELAERAAVSATAVSRFVKYAGFDTFPQLKMALAMDLSSLDSAESARQQSAPQFAPYDPAQYLHDLEIGLHALQQQLTLDLRRQIAQALQQANQIVFFTRISDAAMNLQRELCLRNKLAVIIKGPNPLKEFLYSMKKDDLIFVPAMTDWELDHKLPLAEKAAEKGVKIVLFSAQEHSQTGAFLAKFLLNAPSELVVKMQLDIIYEEIRKAYLSEDGI